MKVLYARVSTLDQKTDRQKINENEYQLVIEDKCSGVIPFFERNGGKEVQNLTEKNVLKDLYVWQIDRLGRDLRDVINTIHYFTQKGICIHFVSQGLRTLQPGGKENPISKMIISILGVVGEMERNQIKERQLEGIKIAKLKGVYLGRKIGSSENVLGFLSKPKNKKALNYLKKGYKNTEVSKILGLNINTITKVKKFGLKSSKIIPT
jgi:DNA invertase Pin-like site-specific DNA recombinase